MSEQQKTCTQTRCTNLSTSSERCRDGDKMNVSLEQTTDGWTRWPQRTQCEPWEMAWDDFMENRKKLYGKHNLEALTERHAFRAGYLAAQETR